MDTVDCVVVGAGPCGLAAAKQYRVLNPNHSLLIFESQSSLGGTWADERLYPDLKSNNLLGTYEFPDFPMDPTVLNVQPGQHIAGHQVNAYLRSYASEFGIIDLIRLQTKVTVAEHQDGPDGGWILTVVAQGEGESKVHARRLIVATGYTSQPFMPSFEGQEDFGGRLFHSKYFKQNEDTVKTARSATVYGGHKSAWDAVYSYAKAGARVHWVIRSSGHGPCWMAPPHVTPFKRWIEKLAHTRLLTWFSPCIWADDDDSTSIRAFLHRTALGRLLVKAFWSLLGRDVLSVSGITSHPKTAQLKPWLPAMFAAASFSILNYDSDMMQLIQGDRVSIHIGQIQRLSPSRVHLADGTSFESDVFVCNSGWRLDSPIKFLPEGVEAELGLPHPVVADAGVEDLANQRHLVDRADEEILRTFPRLADQPVWKEDDVTEKRPTSSTPFMMHRFIVPPSERFLRPRDVAFCGMASNFSTLTQAHLQGLWIGAYFSGTLARDPGSRVGDERAMARLRYETVLHNRFCRWRHPTEHRFPSFIFDAVPYFDVLLRDLGLRGRRKGGLDEIMGAYGVEDYRGVNDEWMERSQKDLD